MGYPYSWHNSSSAGIKGPVPPSITKGRGEFFYSGFSENDYKALIRASILRIMMTNPGERVMLPDFGCDINRFLFDPQDSISELEIKTAISTAIERWEPRITIDNIYISTEDHTLRAEVQYTINGTDLEDVFNYVFSLKNGTE